MQHFGAESVEKTFGDQLSLILGAVQGIEDSTKIFGQMRPDVNGRGLLRKAIFSEIDASLHRLGTDYVDL